MCQTWIWYWVYFRVVRKMPPREIANFVKKLIEEERSLKHIHKFNCWLSDLYHIGFVNRETQSQTNIAESDTPRDPRLGGGSSSRSSAQSPTSSSKPCQNRNSSHSRQTHSRNESSSHAADLVRRQRIKRSTDQQSTSRGQQQRQQQQTTSLSSTKKTATTSNIRRRSNLARAVSPRSRAPCRRHQHHAPPSGDASIRSTSATGLVRKELLRKSSSTAKRRL
jgi:hypothetical protein